MTGSRPPRRGQLRAGALAIVAAAAAAATSFVAPGAHAVGTQAGAATVKSAGGEADLGSGDSSTPFTLRLPSGAACAGDSANEFYFVQSYIVPSSVDPATLQFDADGPTPQGEGANLRHPLYDTSFSPYVNILTAPASPSPGPGPIINIPNFSYGVFGPGNIPAGTYNIGIACTQGTPSDTQLKTFWNTQMTFTTSTSGGPAQVTWVAAAGQATTTTVAGTTTTTVGGSTTTTRVGSTTTTRVGSTTTTTTAGGTTTTVAGGTTTTSVGGNTTTTSSANPLARTGGSPWSLLVWAVVLLVLGRMVVLVVRTSEVGPGGQR